jgi:hypothetical protein
LSEYNFQMPGLRGPTSHDLHYLIQLVLAHREGRRPMVLMTTERWKPERSIPCKISCPVGYLCGSVRTSFGSGKEWRRVCQVKKKPTNPASTALLVSGSFGVRAASPNTSFSPSDTTHESKPAVPGTRRIYALGARKCVLLRASWSGRLTRSLARSDAVQRYGRDFDYRAITAPAHHRNGPT